MEGCDWTHPAATSAQLVRGQRNDRSSSLPLALQTPSHVRARGGHHPAESSNAGARDACSHGRGVGIQPNAHASGGVFEVACKAGRVLKAAWAAQRSRPSAHAKWPLQPLVPRNTGMRRGWWNAAVPDSAQALFSSKLAVVVLHIVVLGVEKPGVEGPRGAVRVDEQVLGARHIGAGHLDR